MSAECSKIVIIGGGIHGVSTAYYLSTHYKLPCAIVEQTSIACAASGKAGGFLAREWGSGPTVPLHQISYDLHKSLALELGISSYREITTLSVDGSRKGKNLPSWLDRKATSAVMDSRTAQVTPAEYTEKLLEAAINAGCELIIDSAIGVVIDNGQVAGVKLRNRGVLATVKVVICLGPWAGVAVEDWFDIPLPMEGIKSTSVIFNEVSNLLSEPYACFCGEDENDCHLELYPRNNGDLYICGCGGSDHVKGDRLREHGDCARAELVLADPARVAAATASLKSLSSIGDLTPDVSQACMRPCTTDGNPVMGAIPHVQGAYISAGHNCWGILWAPASGLCMAELVATGECKTVNLLPFSLDRFTKKSSSARGRKMVSTSVGEQW